MNTRETDETVETKLTRALQVEPTQDGLNWLDRRVAEVMAERAAPRRRRWLRMLMRPVPLIAAFILLTGAVAGALSLIERTATEAGGGFSAAWEKAEVLEITREDQGYQITLERVYADVNHVLAFLSVRGPGADDAAGEPADSVFLTSSLHDPTGRALEKPYGMTVGATDLAAIIDSWGPPAEAGTYVLTVTAIEADALDDSNDHQVIEGEWRFEFDLPEPVGIVVATEASDTDAGVTVELAELRISPTMITGSMYLAMEDGSEAPVWMARIGAIRHDGTDVNPNPGTDPMMAGVPIREEERTGFQFQTAFGADVASGTWEIEISEISFPELYMQGLPPDPASETAGVALPTPNESYRPRSGTWTLTVTVP